MGQEGGINGEGGAYYKIWLPKAGLIRKRDLKEKGGGA